MNDLDTCPTCGPCQHCDSLERHSKTQEPPKRPLKLEWTEEMADDLEAFHGGRGPFLTMEPMDSATLGGYSDEYIEGFANALLALFPNDTEERLMERGMRASEGRFNPVVLAKYLSADETLSLKHALKYDKLYAKVLMACGDD